MNLQKRIFRLNMVMLIISMLAILGVSIYVANSIYQNRANMQSTSQRTATSQSSIEQFTGTDFASLASQLAMNGAQLHVEEAGQVLYSNIEEDIEDLAGVTVSKTAHVSYVDGEVVISRLLVQEGKYYQLYALFEDSDSQSGFSEFQSFLSQLLLVGGIGMVLVTLVNFLFTRRMLAVILRPLNQLHAAVERISRGNYQEPIDYQGDREFEALTKGFNNMQESLAIAEQQTTLYEKNRTQMVADISHDLRTPLTSIKGYAKGVLDGVANTDEMRERYLQTIYQKSLAMEQLLEKLLLFSNLDTDQMPFDFQIVDLQEILITYLTEKQVEFTDGQVQFIVDLVPQTPVKVDIVQFKRVLDNLLENARKYAKVDNLVITLTSRVKGEKLELLFADNGRGVSEQAKDRLFEAFYREDQARQGADGHGLGLAIVKDIIERLGGSIRVDNCDGLVFTILLPLEKEND